MILCLLYLEVKTTETPRKNARNVKTIQVRSDDDIKKKISAKCANVEVSSLGLVSKVLPSLGLALEGCGLDYITQGRP